MSEEEKEVIDKLSGKKNETTWYDTIRQIKREKITDVVVTRQKYITILLNLIDKQQKETENLKSKIHSLIDLYKQEKEKNKKQQKEIEQLANGIRVLGTNLDITTEEIIKEFTEKPITEEYMEEFKSRYISKNKVLKAMGYEENDEEYERIKQDDEKLLAILDTLYSEVCRLEDIEDKKVEVAVDFIEEKRDKYWQNKIIDKIKNSEMLKHNYLANTETSAIVYKNIIDIVDAQINVLKELLEES